MTRAKRCFRRSAVVAELRRQSKIWNKVLFRGPANARFRIWEFCRFPLPCFATGCHAFGLKIATAALRPRNDKDLERFCLGNARFLLYAGNFARCRSVADFNSLIAKVVGFHEKPTTFFVIARRPHRPPPRQSLTEPHGIPERGTARPRYEKPPRPDRGAAV